MTLYDGLNLRVSGVSAKLHGLINSVLESVWMEELDRSTLLEYLIKRIIPQRVASHAKSCHVHKAGASKQQQSEVIDVDNGGSRKENSNMNNAHTIMPPPSAASNNMTMSLFGGKINIDNKTTNKRVYSNGDDDNCSMPYKLTKMTTEGKNNCDLFAPPPTSSPPRRAKKKGDQMGRRDEMDLCDAEEVFQIQQTAAHQGPPLHMKDVNSILMSSARHQKEREQRESTALRSSDNRTMESIEHVSWKSSRIASEIKPGDVSTTPLHLNEVLMASNRNCHDSIKTIASKNANSKATTMTSSRVTGRGEKLTLQELQYSYRHYAHLNNVSMDAFQGCSEVVRNAGKTSRGLDKLLSLFPIRHNEQATTQTGSESSIAAMCLLWADGTSTHENLSQKHCKGPSENCTVWYCSCQRYLRIDRAYCPLLGLLIEYTSISGEEIPGGSEAQNGTYYLPLGDARSDLTEPTDKFVLPFPLETTSEQRWRAAYSILISK